MAPGRADGKLIVYSNGNNLFTAKSDGSDRKKIVTVGDSGFIFNPVWSPDGNHFRFAYQPNLAIPDYFMEVSLDGTGLHRLLPGWTKPEKRTTESLGLVPETSRGHRLAVDRASSSCHPPNFSCAEGGNGRIIASSRRRR
jgi:hypothetical protein